MSPSLGCAELWLFGPYNPEDLADDGRVVVEPAAFALAHAGEVVDVSVAPVRERPIAFAFDGCEALVHFAERLRLHERALDDRGGCAIASNDDAQVARPRQLLAERSEFHRKARGRAL